jgi:hypothetical protein
MNGSFIHTAHYYAGCCCTFRCGRLRQRRGEVRAARRVDLPRRVVAIRGADVALFAPQRKERRPRLAPKVRGMASGPAAAAAAPPQQQSAGGANRAALLHRRRGLGGAGAERRAQNARVQIAAILVRTLARCLTQHLNLGIPASRGNCCPGSLLFTHHSPLLLQTDHHPLCTLVLLAAPSAPSPLLPLPRYPPARCRKPAVLAHKTGVDSRTLVLPAAPSAPTPPLPFAGYPPARCQQSAVLARTTCLFRCALVLPAALSAPTPPLPFAGYPPARCQQSAVLARTTCLFRCALVLPAALSAPTPPLPLAGHPPARCEQSAVLACTTRMVRCALMLPAALSAPTPLLPLARYRPIRCQQSAVLTQSPALVSRSSRTLMLPAARSAPAPLFPLARYPPARCLQPAVITQPPIIIMATDGVLCCAASCWCMLPGTFSAPTLPTLPLAVAHLPPARCRQSTLLAEWLIDGAARHRLAAAGWARPPRARGDVQHDM